MRRAPSPLRRPIIASTRARTCSFFCSRRALGHQRVLPVAQRAVFFLQLSADAEELVEPFLEPLQLEIEAMILWSLFTPRI